MSNSAHAWTGRLARTVLILVFATATASAEGEFKLVEEWPRTELKFEPGTEGISYDEKLNRYVGLEPISTIQGEQIKVSVGSYAFQPTITLLDANNEPQGRSRHKPEAPTGDGNIWYETELEFECCPGARSEDGDIPTNYVLRYSSRDVVEVGTVYVWGARFAFQVTEDPLPFPANCDCFDPVSGRSYEGSLGGTI
jgi:hypothetical protein